MTITFEAADGYNLGRHGTDHAKHAEFTGTSESIGWGTNMHPDPQETPITLYVYKDNPHGGASGTEDIVETYQVLGKPAGGKVNDLDIKPGSQLTSEIRTVITSS
jgi:hypothetical protein